MRVQAFQSGATEFKHANGRGGGGPRARGDYKVVEGEPTFVTRMSQ